MRINVRCMLWREHLQGTAVGGPPAAPQYWLKLRQPRVVAWVGALSSLRVCDETHWPMAAGTSAPAKASAVPLASHTLATYDCACPLQHTTPSC